MKNKNGTTLKLACLTSLVSLYAIVNVCLTQWVSISLILMWYLSNLFAQVLCVLVLMGKC